MKGDRAVNYRLSRFLPLARLGYHSVPDKDYMALYFKEGTDVVIAHVFHQSQDYARIVEEGLLLLDNLIASAYSDTFVSHADGTWNYALIGALRSFIIDGVTGREALIVIASA